MSTTHTVCTGIQSSVRCMKLVMNIVAISRGGSYRDVLTKFLTVNPALAKFVDTASVSQRIDEIYRIHCDTVQNIEYQSDYLMHTSLSWISENIDGSAGAFKYIIFTYKANTGKSIKPSSKKRTSCACQCTTACQNIKLVGGKSVLRQ